jgi:hypothetical protein
VRESSSSCPQDCVFCGDGVCNGSESITSCPRDCSTCGNFTCELLDFLFCPEECGSGPIPVPFP